MYFITCMFFITVVMYCICGLASRVSFCITAKLFISITYKRADGSATFLQSVGGESSAFDEMEEN